MIATSAAARRKRGVSPTSGGAGWPSSHRPQRELCWPTSSSRTMSSALGASTPKYSAAGWSSPERPTYVALSNSWIIINVGGGPTDDKPAVTLETPRDPDRVSSFLNIRVKDIAGRVRRMERPGCSVPDAAETAPVRDPLLHPRSRRSSDRSGANHGPRGGLVGVVAVSLGAMKMAMVDASSCSRPAAVHPFRPYVVTARRIGVVAGRDLAHATSWVTERVPVLGLSDMCEEAPVFGERTSVGLDVHARSVVAAAIDGQTGEVFKARLTPSHAEVLGVGRHAAGSVRGGLRVRADRVRAGPRVARRRGGAARWRRRRSCSARPGIGSRPTREMPCIWRGCCGWTRSCRCGSRARPRRPRVIWSGPGRRRGRI